MSDALSALQVQAVLSSKKDPINKTLLGKKPGLKTWWFRLKSPPKLTQVHLKFQKNFRELYPRIRRGEGRDGKESKKSLKYALLVQMLINMFRIYWDLKPWRHIKQIRWWDYHKVMKKMLQACIHQDAVEFLVNGKIIKCSKLLPINNAPECGILHAKFQQLSGVIYASPWREGTTSPRS
jgi:hypothetical protein